ncbi:Hypothetical protein, putative [Bodo saltans]|uniref:Ferric reductase NAD binding domain-containing protein n=1 Tax=Bodo saltans TaxID=75058 RepID=A0A0S4IIM4_BODSA|nr:Hypothetical protein, putative [Bodo saltans]|eukprot:CUE72424.1 Hypothetical protein, putative [Bodo saltans]
MISILEYIATNIAVLPKLKDVTFLWAARDKAMIDYLKGTIDGFASTCARKVRVSIQLFDTGSSRLLDILPAPVPPPGGAIEMDDIFDMALPGDPRISSGRPNFQKLFATIRGEGVGCYVCGPASLRELAVKEASKRGFWVHCETFEF